MIPREALRRTCLKPQMAHYFRKKLAPLPSDEIDLRIEELLKFLSLAVHTSGPIPVWREIDGVWHYWVLQTAEYASLCAKLPGGLFGSHSSNEHEEFEDPDVKQTPPDPTAMIAFLGAYVKNYGPFEPDRVRHWTFATWLMNGLGWSLGELNGRLFACVGGAVLDSDPLRPGSPATERRGAA